MNKWPDLLVFLLIMILLFTRRSSARSFGRAVGKIGNPPRPEPPRARRAAFDERTGAATLSSPESSLDKYYRILELKPSASPEEIQQAYRELAKVWHPDRFPNDPSLKERANAKLREINEAYEVLRVRR